LKYSLAVAIELGISLPQDFASINEVKTFVNNRPLARLIDKNKTTFFITFFITKMVVGEA
jgi:hypothetical protein